MAQELQIQLSINFSKGGALLSRTFGSTYFDVSGAAGIANVIAVGTSDETLALGDVATNGWLYMKNLDATNYITAGADGTLYNIKMKAGEPFLGRWNGAAIHVKANTAQCQMEYLLIPD